MTFASYHDPRTRQHRPDQRRGEHRACTERCFCFPLTAATGGVIRSRSTATPAGPVRFASDYYFTVLLREPVVMFVFASSVTRFPWR
jgi:hypothetical protein